MLLLWLMPSFAPRPPETRARTGKHSRRAPLRAKTLPRGGGGDIQSSPTHPAVRINAQAVSRPKGHTRSSSAHQVLTMRAITHRSMARTSTEFHARNGSPRSAKVGSRASRKPALGSQGSNVAKHVPRSTPEPIKAVTPASISSSPAPPLVPASKSACASPRKGSFEEPPMPSKMTLVSTTLGAVLDASVTVPVKAAKSSLASAGKASKFSLASAGKASLAHANKASLRLSNFAKLQRMSTTAPSPVATPLAEDPPASILFVGEVPSATPATIPSATPAAILSATATANLPATATVISPATAAPNPPAAVDTVSSTVPASSSSATPSASSSAATTAPISAAVLSESPTSFLPEGAGSGSCGPSVDAVPPPPFVDVVPPTPQMVSEGTCDGPVAPRSMSMGSAVRGLMGFATSSGALDERQGARRSLFVDAGDASSKRYSI
ncbi:hypothetical protein FB107DRAFT_250440 [Schizophyllum commune]